MFTVVHEQVLTDTTRYADVVLPATTSFEIDDVNQPARWPCCPSSPSTEWVRARSNDETGLALAGVRVRLGRPRPALAVADFGRESAAPSHQFVDTVPAGD